MNDESWSPRGQAIDVRPRDRRISRRQTIIGASFLAAAAAGVAFKPRLVEKLLGNAKLDQLVPREFAGWRFQATSGLVLPPQDQLRDQIYSQLLTRVYAREDGVSIMLLIAYSGAQDGTIQIHRPEVCYPASGYHLVESVNQQIPITNNLLISGRYIVAEAQLAREQLIYWTRLGSHFPTRWSEQKTAVIAENFAGVVPDGVLVRISSTIAGDGRALFDSFARDLYAAVGSRMREVLVGTVLARA